MYTLIYLKWITNTVLLYSTGNSAQCFVAAGMGRVWGRMDSCMYRTESLGCPLETITTLLICYACICLSRVSRVWLSATQWTVACQVTLSKGFSRQEYLVGCHALFRGSSQIRDWTLLCFLHWQVGFLPPAILQYKIKVFFKKSMHDT